MSCVCVLCICVCLLLLFLYFSPIRFCLKRFLLCNQERWAGQLLCSAWFLERAINLPSEFGIVLLSAGSSGKFGFLESCCRALVPQANLEALSDLSCQKIAFGDLCCVALTSPKNCLWRSVLCCLWFSRFLIKYYFHMCGCIVYVCCFRVCLFIYVCLMLLLC